MKVSVIAAIVVLSLGCPAIAQNKLIASPSTLNFILDPNDEIFQSLWMDSSSGPVAFTMSSSSDWLSASVYELPGSSVRTPTRVTVSVITKGLTVGVYQGMITLKSAENTVIVPVTLTVTNGPPLHIDAICNAASYASGTISPGEVISIFGSFEITTNTLEVLNGGVWYDLDGVTVQVTGVNSTSKLSQTFYSPLIYTSPTQISAVVPYGISPGPVSVSVYSNGYLSSTEVSQTMVSVVPGLFTSNSSGTGQGAILNQDYGINSTLNPAAKGSVVMLYLTGEGNTNPGGVTGGITQVRATAPITPTPIGAVQVLIDGFSANVSFAGEAPGMVSGVMQVNAQIPEQAHSGSVSLKVSVGGVWSQSNVTVAVR